MAKSTRETRRSIKSTLERLGEASRFDIAKALGPKWLEEKKLAALDQLLRRMVDTHHLKKVGRGRYRLSPSHAWRSLDTWDQTERAIEAFLMDGCGIARTRDIQAAVGYRSLLDAKRDYEHQRVTMTLKESPLFHHKLGRGYWHLSEERLEALPLPGFWAVNWHEKDAAFFRSVGSAFTAARLDRGLSRLDVVSNPIIRDALEDMALSVLSAKGDALDEMRGDIAAEYRASGVADPRTIQQAYLDRMDSDLSVYLYAAFEAGAEALHFAAPVEFYRACARLYQVDAARLSRGIVEQIFQPVAAE